MSKDQPTTREQIERGITLLRRSLAFWKRGLAVFVLGVVIVVPFVFTRPRAYRSETVILYHETIRSSDLTGGESGENPRRVGARLREFLLSRSTLEPIINDLRLYSKHGDPLDTRELVDAVDEMRKAITFRAREGDTFEIAFVGGTPEEAQKVTQRLAEAIIQEAATRRAENAKALKEFLEAESARNDAELKQKEAELAKFVADHPALAARLQGLPPVPGSSGGAGGGATTTSNTGDPVLATLEARAAQIQRQLKAANETTPPKPPPTFKPPPDSPELIAARKDLAEKSARYTDKHPDVIAAKARLRAAEAAQEAAYQKALEAFRASQAQDPPPPKNAADEASLRQELASLQAKIAARRAALAKEGDAGAAPAASAIVGGPEVALEVEFRRLTREVNEARERQRQLDEKLFKASITASSVMNDRNIQVSVLDPAYLPTTPVSKSRKTMLAVLLMLCIALAIATCIGSAVLDDRIYDRGDLERLDVLPVIAVIPRAELPPKRGDP